MQQDFFIIKDKIFRCEAGVDQLRGEDTSALALFSRPYYTEAQKPENHKFSEDLVNHKAIYWGENIHIRDCEIDGRGCAEGLKISFGHNIRVENCVIYGGYEDCVDIVRGANITFINCKFISVYTKQHLTIKGGCKNITIEDCEFVNDFTKWYDGALVDIGNYTIYDQVQRPKVRHVTIRDCRLTNIKHKLLTRVLYGDVPNIYNTKGYVFKVPNFITKIFFKLRNSGKLGKLPTLDLADKLVYELEQI
jgi:hypothetical protein